MICRSADFGAIDRVAVSKPHRRFFVAGRHSHNTSNSIALQPNRGSAVPGAIDRVAVSKPHRRFFVAGRHSHNTSNSMPLQPNRGSAVPGANCCGVATK